ncbi:MAG: 2-amino-4-hydroxy-6-hydroxymethyldihydropteridine diphosphokinase [Desulfovibrionaceae bacterium]
MITVFISLGSNLGDAQGALAKARIAVAALEGVDITAASPLYKTEPQGFHDQPWFVNQVLQLACAEHWQPSTLLHALLHVETCLGRVRSSNAAVRFGPRCIDIDLLLFGNEHCLQPSCQVPHPRMHERAFVLVPLQDIAPQVTIAGTRIDKLLQDLAYSVKDQRILQ